MPTRKGGERIFTPLSEHPFTPLRQAPVMQWGLSHRMFALGPQTHLIGPGCERDFRNDAGPDPLARPVRDHKGAWRHVGNEHGYAHGTEKIN